MAAAAAAGAPDGGQQDVVLEGMPSYVDNDNVARAVWSLTVGSIERCTLRVGQRQWWRWRCSSQ